MVLRHQVRILERQLNVRAAYRPVDRAILATLSRLLARWRWRSFLVTPETLLCWHREVSRRKWRRWRSKRGLKGAQTHFRPREVGSERERGLREIECARCAGTPFGGAQRDELWSRAPAGSATVRVESSLQAVFEPQAARSYSWTMPPRTECRRTTASTFGSERAIGIIRLSPR